MSKVKSVPKDLRQMRLKERNFSQTKPAYSPSEIYLSVLGNGAAGSPRCLYMFCDQGRYLFNCGEGTQRLAHEYKMKLSKLEHIFITHKSWENVGGLLGLSLTIQDIGVPQITLHGPPDIENLYNYSRSFILTKDLTIAKRNVADPPHVDNCMQVQYVPIYSSKVKERPTEISYSSPDTDSDAELEHKQKKIKLCEPESSPDVTVAYICKGHNKLGHLIVEKCIEQGVPPGPLLGELKNGKDITLSSGRIVRSQDVVSPEQPCPVFLVVECPSEDFLDAFVNEEKFKICQESTAPQDVASLVVHFSPPHIVKSCKYQEWMKRFPESTCHLILNTDNATINSAAIHRIQCMLNLLHPKVFNLLQENETKEDCKENEGLNAVQARAAYKYYLRPNKGLESVGINVEPETFVQEAKNTPGFINSLNELKIAIDKKIDENIEEEEYPEVVFLGTGSSIPSKVRNVSCILLNTSPDHSVLMDCGEGSYNQLLHVYGPDATQSILKGLSCIFISHLHADHHLGLITFLKQRKAVFDLLEQEYLPVTIIGPSYIIKWLKSYHKKFEHLSSLYRFIDNNSIKYDKKYITEDEQSILMKSCRNIDISTIPVNHCPSAFGLMLEAKSEWKIVYSGDTTPCQQLVTAGKDCTLLIHEATMEDDLDTEAALKMHSTTSQAVEIAEKMNAKYAILTHFSQRYAKVPLFNKNFHSHVGCAFDNMKVRRCDLPVIPLFIPTLKILFAEHVEELQIKGNKRKEKIQLLCKAQEMVIAANS